MDAQPEEPDAGPAAPPSSPRRGPDARRPRTRWPLAALAFTTATLAASAWQVVASSIVEGGTPALLPGPIRESAAAVSLGECPSVASEESPGIEKAPPSHPDPDDSPPTPAPRPPSQSGRPPAPRPDILGKVDKARPKAAPTPAPAKPAVEPPPPAPPRTDARRILVRDPDGRPMVARVYGQDGDHVAAILPDGQIGYPDGLVDTDRPFVPLTMAEIREKLLAREFAEFQAMETRHYLVLYQGSKGFASTSARTLEDLYANLTTALSRCKVQVHEAEFPLVAVIFRTEEDFRARKKVPPDVQAYYEIGSNRIFLYETSIRDQSSPEVSALRKPQTVAHEGTHQILQNIGVHPRLADWPLWLVEGLAEYCSSPSFIKNGQPAWQRIGQVNHLHVATFRDLDDPLSTQVRGARIPVVARDQKRSLVEYVVTKTALTPTDYALAWGLTYHLAKKHQGPFVDYLREMSQVPPLAKRTPADHLRDFKAAFGKIGTVDHEVLGSLRKLILTVESLPYYAVVFEQQVAGGVVNRAAVVSQSPLFIRQWIEHTTSPRGDEPRWHIFTHPTKARALITAEEWLGHGG